MANETENVFQIIWNGILFRAGFLGIGQKCLICTVILGILLAGFYFAAFQDRWQVLEKKRKNLLLQQQLLSAYQTKSRMLEKVARQMELKTNHFLAAGRALPEKKQLAHFLKNIAGAGKDAHVHLISVQEKREADRGFYREVSWEMELTGTYGQLLDFLARVSQLDRIVTIETMAMERDKNTSLVRMICTAVTYQELSD